VLVRDPHGRARRLVAAARAHVVLERVLARGDRVLDAAQEPQRLRQPVARVGRFLGGERGLECGARRVPARILERRPAFEELVAGTGIHDAIIAGREGDSA
jgi:hypothetical protein